MAAVQGACAGSRAVPGRGRCPVPHWKGRVCMQTVTLGRTGITVNKNGFGALPIQRVGADYAGKLLRKAYDAGITYFDTARSYTDSEEKMGLALADVRQHIFIATKTPSTTVEGFWKDLETSLRLLKTDYIDVYQFHNPAFCPKPGDGTGPVSYTHLEELEGSYDTDVEKAKELLKEAGYERCV